MFWYELKSVGVEPATGNPKLPAQVGVGVGVTVGVEVGVEDGNMVVVKVGVVETVNVGVTVGVGVIVDVIVGVEDGNVVVVEVAVGVIVEVQGMPPFSHPGKKVLVGVGVKVGSVVGV